MRSTSWQFLALLSWSLIAGIDDLVKSFFQKVSPLGIAGMPCGCRAFGHGKQKMRIYFQDVDKKIWTNSTRLLGCICRREQGEANTNRKRK